MTNRKICCFNPQENCDMAMKCQASKLNNIAWFCHCHWWWWWWRWRWHCLRWWRWRWHRWWWWWWWWGWRWRSWWRWPSPFSSSLSLEAKGDYNRMPQNLLNFTFFLFCTIMTFANQDVCNLTYLRSGFLVKSP